MKHSEFWQVVETTFGPAHGRALAEDLVLSRYGRTAVGALAAGASPRDVWDALCDEMEVDDAARWSHRRDPKEQGRR